MAYPAKLLERDWLSYLLQDIKTIELDCHSNPNIPFGTQSIVVDNCLSSEKEGIYKAAFLAGSRICLIHLSDELFHDNVTTYRWCDLVYRNYYSPFMATLRSVKTFPLGYKWEFKVNTIGSRASARACIWGFAGDAKKSSRAEMLNQMSSIDNGKQYITSGFGSSNALPTAEYQTFLTEIAFSPCPAGFQNLELLRIYESLECGAIPIIEMRNGLDYFSYLFGRHPLPTIAHWSEAPGLIKRL